MWKYPTFFDVIVVGGGHAGCEAAHAAAKMGRKTLLLTMNLDTIAKASCNPSIGGTAKGHIVREIDALGGIMGKIADKSGIHFRLLNRSKGPAVRSPRAQIDKVQYHVEIKKLLENTQNLELKQAVVVDVVIENNKVIGVKTEDGVFFQSKSTILCNGTFLKGLMHIGKRSFEGGRSGDLPCKGVSISLKDVGLKLDRLKTGTPPRLHAKSINYDTLEKQPSENDIFFSYDEKTHPLPSISCYITYTTENTKEIINRDLNKSALFAGIIKGVGPRYCPSIESKVTRFADKERHQVFLEPEGLNTVEIYVNGISSSMPYETQMQIIHSIIGLEKAEIMRPAYAIEYDYLLSGQVLATLETKLIKGLFIAGQLNGTTGYEEAAGQGLIAGINAALLSQNKDPFILPRSSSYIGVMIDDLIIKKIEEPYRMFTSRAEHRLHLRQDNADIRLREFGYDLGLISSNQVNKLKKKKEIIETEKTRMTKKHISYETNSTTLAKLLCRPEITYPSLLDLYPSDVTDYGKDINEQIEIELKYFGYMQRQKKEIEKLKNLERILIPESFSYEKVIGLRNEAKEKLISHHPFNLASAARIDGVSIADISILMVALQKTQLASSL